MRLLRRNARSLLIFLLAVGTWAAVYAYDKGFSQKWRSLIMEEFEKRGIEAQIGKLTIDPIDGLVARNVKIFATEKRQSVVASINNVTLDIDLAKLLRKELFLNTIQLRDADISLPIDPTVSDTDRLEIKNFSARIRIPGNRFEIEQAECLFNGFRVTLVGSLLQPTFEGPTDGHQSLLGRIDIIRQRREVLDIIASEMRRYKAMGNNLPHIHIELVGDLEHPESIKATLDLNASNLLRNNYQCDNLYARAHYLHPDLFIEQVNITDQHGELLADAKWRIGSEKIPFNVQSTIDSPALLTSLTKSNTLNEINFATPPVIEAKGEIFISGKNAESTHGMYAMGSLACEGISSRGEYFQTTRADFSISPERWYVRDLQLEHRSGTLQSNILYETSGNINYDAIITMDPETFAPFVDDDQTKELLQRFKFSNNPAVNIHFSGSGLSDKPSTWHTNGHFRIGQCRYQNIPLLGATGAFEINPEGMIFQDFRIDPAEGHFVDGKLAQFLDREEIVILEGIRGRAYPAHIASYFSTQTAEALAQYHFETAPDLTLEGIIDSSDGGRSRFTSTFQSSAPANFILFERNLSIIEPEGTVTISGNLVELDITGKLFGGQAEYVGSIKMANEGSSISGHLKAEEINFAPMASLYGVDDTNTEGTLACELHFDIPASSPEKWTAKATTTISNADIFSMPFMGKISRQINANLATRTASLPFLISSVLDAKQTVNSSQGATINATFQNEGNGILQLTNFTGVAPGFTLQANGEINTLKTNDQLNIKAEMNARGPLKIVGWPISKLFKYQCKGSFDAPKWHAVNFSLLNRPNTQQKGILDWKFNTRGILPIPRVIIRPRANNNSAGREEASRNAPPPMD